VGLTSGIVAGGLGSKSVAHVEDVKGKLLPSFDSDRKARTAVAMAKQVVGGHEQGWK
jgi:hypothetical protein